MLSRYLKSSADSAAVIVNANTRMNDSIFKWMYGKVKKPEDIAFYREDGSVFLSSVIHEGEDSLFPREGEDISAILDLDNWYLVDDAKRWFKL